MKPRHVDHREIARCFPSERITAPVESFVDAARLVMRELVIMWRFGLKKKAATSNGGLYAARQDRLGTFSEEYLDLAAQAMMYLHRVAYSRSYQVSPSVSRTL